ncbi:hypothetical protein ACFFRR_003827 [Megaselia abdita]
MSPVFTSVIALLLTRVYCHQNLTLQHKLYRAKRGIVFEGGGFNKMLFNFIHNVPLEDPIYWRDLLGILNIQCQYNVPTSPLYPWDFGDNYERSMQSVKEEFEKTGHSLPDESRTFVYEFLITFMNQKGVNGEECLKKSICENSQIDHHEGLFAEILGALLTPGLVEDPYKDYFLAGKYGVNCQEVFSGCPRGDSIFDRIVVDV